MDITLVACGSRPWQYLAGYWGLSYLVDGDILYDTFYDYSILTRKLRKINVSPLEIQSVVISHEHSDHTGGLWGFLEEKPEINVYFPSSSSQSIKDRVVSTKGRLIEEPGVKTLRENVLISEEMIGVYGEHRKKVAEHFLLVKTSFGPVILVGCSHPGIIRMVKKAKDILGEPVLGVIGGFHLMHENAESVRNCAKDLKNEGVKIIAPTHCTGWLAERTFKKVFGDGFRALREGQTLSL